MVRFQIMSDLHLEAPSAYDVFSITPKSSCLALLGDIGNIKDKGFFPFLEVQLKKFEHVFFLLGNHEPYHSSFAKVRAQIQDFSDKIDQRRSAKKGDDGRLGKLVFLDQTRYDLSSEVTILGCTLYSQVLSSQHDRVSFGLNDFYHIEDWTVADISAREPHRKIVVFTHHSPSTAEGTSDPAHKASPISSSFSTDLSREECWVNPSVKLWAFGHTHFNCNLEDPATKKRLVSNQRGYYFAQATVFDPDRVYEVK
ncbi:uncharacterized protein PV07_04889 [Cladophialophora immunda]|uniref:Calcineurin-like phosphoesterase domain-containing protein n=1 Tax=Cladophialophora immunda TaxID=569365 RepID=A0A0D2CD68_9EURO|nr:uncharacterized protein PV07_04889 [Cladophialophora immunda]KIW29043.1 hypothetical protein PV07_04889 [Cladophialophora immunda]